MKKIFFSIFKGAVKAIPVAGSIINEIKSNKDSHSGGKGKVDKPRMISYGLGGVLVLGRLIFPEYVNGELINQIIELIF